MLEFTQSNFSIQLFHDELQRNKTILVLRIYAHVPDHVTFLNQVTYSGNLVQTELPIERKPNQITFG